MRGVIAPQLPITPTRKVAQGLYKSTRAGIMIAFVVPVVLLGVACAMSTGAPIVWENAYLGAALIFFLIMISNGLNNIVDEKIDVLAMELGLEKSRSYNVLNLTTGLTRSQLTSIIVLSGFCSGLLLMVLASRAGFAVFGFALFGLFMALEYNLPPLKLAYQPFPELTMLFPSAAVAVIGIQYILVSHTTPFGIAMGIAFGLFSGSWFVYQSIIDYDVDRSAGKTTTAVYVGPLRAALIGGAYPVCALTFLTAHVISSGSAVALYPTICATVCAAVLAAMIVLCGLDAHKMWQRAMLMTFVFGVMSALLIVYRVWSG